MCVTLHSDGKIGRHTSADELHETTNSLGTGANGMGMPETQQKSSASFSALVECIAHRKTPDPFF